MGVARHAVRAAGQSVFDLVGGMERVGAGDSICNPCVRRMRQGGFGQRLDSGYRSEQLGVELWLL